MSSFSSTPVPGSRAGESSAHANKSLHSSAERAPLLHALSNDDDDNDDDDDDDDDDDEVEAAAAALGDRKRTSREGSSRSGLKHEPWQAGVNLKIVAASYSFLVQGMMMSTIGVSPSCLPKAVRNDTDGECA
jgi:hypothetical protein